MILKLTRNQIIELIFALELAEDNAPELRKWEPLRDEIRRQLSVQDAGREFLKCDGQRCCRYCINYEKTEVYDLGICALDKHHISGSDCCDFYSEEVEQCATQENGE